MGKVRVTSVRSTWPKKNPDQEVIVTYRRRGMAGTASLGQASTGSPDEGNGARPEPKPDALSPKKTGALRRPFDTTDD
jgi:hypothetical protein